MSEPQMQDKIEAKVQIQAPLEQVWSLVSTPGWWINDGSIVEHKISQVGNKAVLIDPVHGQFTLLILESLLQEQIRYRWACEGDAAPAPISTEIAFFLLPKDDGTQLQVIESGFAAAQDKQRAYRLFQENSQGWNQELELAKAHLEKLG